MIAVLFIQYIVDNIYKPYKQYFDSIWYRIINNNNINRIYA